MGSSREELIDLKKNKLFTECKTILDIKEVYEQFWNYLNPKSNDIVYVQSIRVPFKKELTRRGLK